MLDVFGCVLKKTNMCNKMRYNEHTAWRSKPHLKLFVLLFTSILMFFFWCSFLLPSLSPHCMFHPFDAELYAGSKQDKHLNHHLNYAQTKAKNEHNEFDQMALQKSSWISHREKIISSPRIYVRYFFYETETECLRDAVNVMHKNSLHRFRAF